MPHSTASLREFLSRLPGQKEVGLAVMQAESDRAACCLELEAEGFRSAKTPKELAAYLQKTGSVIFSVSQLDDATTKDLYDLALQYPTGQVTGFDADKMKPFVVNPMYVGTSVLLVLTQLQLEEFISRGFDLLSACGPVYRNA